MVIKCFVILFMSIAVRYFCIRQRLYCGNGAGIICDAGECLARRLC